MKRDLVAISAHGPVAPFGQAANAKALPQRRKEGAKVAKEIQAIPFVFFASFAPSLRLCGKPYGFLVRMNDAGRRVEPLNSPLHASRGAQRGKEN